MAKARVGKAENNLGKSGSLVQLLVALVAYWLSYWWFWWPTRPATSGTGGLLVELLVALEPTSGY